MKAITVASDGEKKEHRIAVKMVRYCPPVFGNNLIVEFVDGTYLRCVAVQFK